MSRAQKIEIERGDAPAKRKRGRTLALRLAVTATSVVCAAGASAKDLPHLQRNGQSTQLMVDGAPYLILGGELHNSSPSSPAYMAPIWDRLAKNGVRTVIGAASWELVEPEEGRYDFTALDDQIRQAHAHGLRLVLIWFGAYKNAESTYAPRWVRQDEARFPRAERDPAFKATGAGAFLRGPVLSVFNPALLQADARAFTALMRHIKQVDRDQTVILIQVENETGLLGDSRDRSKLAETVWRQQVPAELMAYLAAHREELRPRLLDAWSRNGFRPSGTWAEVFGTDSAAEEIFMAWGFGRYVGAVAKAGAAEYPLPMYANAWLGPQPRAMNPGDYPSGGPVAGMMDVWKAAAPSLAFQSPDIYITDFKGVVADFVRPNNPLFVPEARPDAGNLFLAIGQPQGIGFSPFGVEDFPENSEVFQAYRLLSGMTPVIAKAQSEGRIQGFNIAIGERQQITLGGYDITITGSRGAMAGAFGPGTGSAEQAQARGYGLVVNSGQDEFLIVGRAISPSFAAAGAQVEVDSAQEGMFQNGAWVPGRTLNGDERFALFPNDGVRIVRVKLLRR